MLIATAWKSKINEELSNAFRCLKESLERRNHRLHALSKRSHSRCHVISLSDLGFGSIKEWEGLEGLKLWDEMSCFLGAEDSCWCCSCCLSRLYLINYE